MSAAIKKILRFLGKIGIVWDILLSPLTLIAAVWFRLARFWGIKNLPIMRAIFYRVGVFPIVRHYYEPLFDFRNVGDSSSIMPIDFGDPEQLNLLSSFSFRNELTFPINDAPPGRYYYKNGSFGPGDADLYYSLIRQRKPTRIVEVGSGFSTLVAYEAIRKNKEETNRDTDLVCIEPYEMPFLESLSVRLIRERVEETDTSIFRSLTSGDILFIDSSHIVRPGGDVLFFFQDVLPFLPDGVLVHFHDIFLPEHYPAEWGQQEFRMWNEQYLLEAWLSGRSDVEVICALHYLTRRHPNEVHRAFPSWNSADKHHPGSFWIRIRRPTSS